MYTLRIVHNLKRSTTTGIGEDTVLAVPAKPAHVTDEDAWAVQFARAMAVQFANDVCYLKRGSEVILRCEYSEN